MEYSNDAFESIIHDATKIGENHVVLAYSYAPHYAYKLFCVTSFDEYEAKLELINVTMSPTSTTATKNIVSQTKQWIDIFLCIPIEKYHLVHNCYIDMGFPSTQSKTSTVEVFVFDNAASARSNALQFNRKTIKLDACDHTSNTETILLHTNKSSIRLPTTFLTLRAYNSTQYLRYILKLNPLDIIRANRNPFAILNENINITSNVTTTIYNNCKSGDQLTSKISNLKLSTNDILQRYCSCDEQIRLPNLMKKIGNLINKTKINGFLYNITGNIDDRIILLKLLIYNLDINKTIKNLHKCELNFIGNFEKNLKKGRFNNRDHELLLYTFGIPLKKIRHLLNYKSCLRTYDIRFWLPFFTTINMKSLLYKTNDNCNMCDSKRNNDKRLLKANLFLCEYFIHEINSKLVNIDNMNASLVSNNFKCIYLQFVAIIASYVIVLFDFNCTLRWDDIKMHKLFFNHLFLLLKVIEKYDNELQLGEYKDTYCDEYRCLVHSMYGKYLSIVAKDFNAAIIHFELSIDRYLCPIVPKVSYHKKSITMFGYVGLMPSRCIFYDEVYYLSHNSSAITQRNNRCHYAQILIWSTIRELENSANLDIDDINVDIYNYRKNNLLKAIKLCKNILNQFGYYLNLISLSQLYQTLLRLEMDINCKKKSDGHDIIMMSQAQNLVEIWQSSQFNQFNQSNCLKNKINNYNFVIDWDKISSVPKKTNTKYGISLEHLHKEKCFFQYMIKFGNCSKKNKTDENSNSSNREKYLRMAILHFRFARYYQVIPTYIKINCKDDKIIEQYHNALKYVFHYFKVNWKHVKAFDNPEKLAQELESDMNSQSILQIIRHYYQFLLEKWDLWQKHKLISIIQDVNHFFKRYEKEFLIIFQFSPFQSHILMLFKTKRFKLGYSCLWQLCDNFSLNDWDNFEDLAVATNSDIMVKAVWILRYWTMGFGLNCMDGDTDGNLKLAQYLEKYGMYCATKEICKIAIADSDLEDENKVTLIGAPLLIGFSIRDMDGWLNNIDWIKKEEISNCIGEIRASLYLFVKLIEKNKDDIIDFAHWKYMALLSIGVQSLFCIKMEKFKIYSNTVSVINNSNGKDNKSLNKYNFGSVSRYLRRFVIEYIQSAIALYRNTADNTYTKFQAAVDVNIDAKCLSHVCLMLCYFVLQDKSKFYDMLKRFNNAKLQYSDQGVDCAKNVKKYFCDILFMKKKIGKIKSHNKRIAFLEESINKYNKDRYNAEKIADRKKKLPLILSILNTKKHQLHWKNVLFQKDVKCHYCNTSCDEIQLKICKRCRKTYYCSKKCQKKDWNWRLHKLVCP